MGRLAGRRDRAAEQAFVDERADHRLVAGAVRRDHHIEQKPRRTRSGGQPAHIDDGAEIGAAEHLGFRGRHAELIEGHAIGRQIDRRHFADRCRCLPRVAASNGRRTNARRDAAVGDQQRRQAADADGRERAEAAQAPATVATGESMTPAASANVPTRMTPRAQRPASSRLARSASAS